MGSFRIEQGKGQERNDFVAQRTGSEDVTTDVDMKQPEGKEAEKLKEKEDLETEKLIKNVNQAKTLQKIVRGLQIFCVKSFGKLGEKTAWSQKLSPENEYLVKELKDEKNLGRSWQEVTQSAKSKYENEYNQAYINKTMNELDPENENSVAGKINKQLEVAKGQIHQINIKNLKRLQSDLSVWWYELDKRSQGASSEDIEKIRLAGNSIAQYKAKLDEAEDKYNGYVSGWEDNKSDARLVDLIKKTGYDKKSGHAHSQYTISDSQVLDVAEKELVSQATRIVDEHSKKFQPDPFLKEFMVRFDAASTTEEKGEVLQNIN